MFFSELGHSHKFPLWFSRQILPVIGRHEIYLVFGEKVRTEFAFESRISVLWMLIHEAGSDHYF